MKFRIMCVDAHGEVRRVVVTASSKDAAVAKVEGNGLTVSSIASDAVAPNVPPVPACPVESDELAAKPDPGNWKLTLILAVCVFAFSGVVGLAGRLGLLVASLPVLLLARADWRRRCLGLVGLDERLSAIQQTILLVIAAFLIALAATADVSEPPVDQGVIAGESAPGQEAPIIDSRPQHLLDSEVSSPDETTQVEADIPGALEVRQLDDGNKRSEDSPGILSLSAGSEQKSDIRVWHSTSGSSVEAAFIKFSGGQVELRRTDGRLLRVPLLKLHSDDQKWVMETTGWGRIWESTSGSHVIADLVSADSKSVTLELAGGKTISLSVKKLSAVDQQYIRSRITDDAVQHSAENVFRGKVISVHDGDTLTVLRGTDQVKVRLEGIDAPERGQAFGTAAKKALSSMVYGREVDVTVTGDDKYGRILGIVSTGEAIANEEMLLKGLAWHYSEYNDTESLKRCEAEAKEQKLGVWSEEGPVPPWDWRRWGPAKRKKWLASKETEQSKVSRVRTSSTTLTHWLSSNSGVRHNSSCRWYGNSKGRKCSGREGRACKICGG